MIFNVRHEKKNIGIVDIYDIRPCNKLKIYFSSKSDPRTKKKRIQYSRVRPQILLSLYYPDRSVNELFFVNEKKNKIIISI